ncbi:MAG: ester cyclase, partial [Gramella sp.]|nr:ester cyclase [Christiangramia sp.]
LSMMDSFHEGFSNIKVEITGEPVFAGHKTFTSFIFSGNNSGIFMGNAPTDKEVEVHGFSIWTFNEEGLATREEVYYDNNEFLTQLGYSLSPPEVKK